DMHARRIPPRGRSRSRRPPAKTAKRSREILRERIERRLHTIGTRDHDEIKRARGGRRRRLTTKHLAEPALGAVAFDGAADTTGRDHAQAIMREPVGLAKQG